MFISTGLSNNIPLHMRKTFPCAPKIVFWSDWAANKAEGFYAANYKIILMQECDKLHDRIWQDLMLVKTDSLSEHQFRVE